MQDTRNSVTDPTIDLTTVPYRLSLLGCHQISTQNHRISFWYPTDTGSYLGDLVAKTANAIGRALTFEDRNQWSYLEKTLERALIRLNPNSCIEYRQIWEAAIEGLGRSCAYYEGEGAKADKAQSNVAGTIRGYQDVIRESIKGGEQAYNYPLPRQALPEGLQELWSRRVLHVLCLMSEEMHNEELGGATRVAIAEAIRTLVKGSNAGDHETYDPVATAFRVATLAVFPMGTKLSFTSERNIAVQKPGLKQKALRTVRGEGHQDAHKVNPPLKLFAELVKEHEALVKVNGRVQAGVGTLIGTYKRKYEKNNAITSLGVAARSSSPTHVEEREDEEPVQQQERVEGLEGLERRYQQLDALWTPGLRAIAYHLFALYRDEREVGGMRHHAREALIQILDDVERRVHKKMSAY